MLRVACVSVALALALLCQPTVPLQDAPAKEAPRGECIDHSAKAFRKAKDAPLCWEGVTDEVESGPRAHGAWPQLPPTLEGARVTQQHAVFKLCIGDSGAVEKVLKLRSTGNAAVDEAYCSQLGGWKYPPKKPGSSGAARQQIVTVMFHR